MLKFLKNAVRKKIYESLIYTENDIQFEIFHKLHQGFMEKKYSTFRKKYNIHENFRFNGNMILFYGEGEIECGENSYVSDYSMLQSYDNCKITIGKGCSISSNVRIFTQTNISNQDFSLENRAIKISNVLIGDYVWIGANVVINPGIIIGNNSIIGANSVVTKDVPENTIYGGVPAKLIRTKEY